MTLQLLIIVVGVVLWVRMEFVSSRVDRLGRGIQEHLTEIEGYLGAIQDQLDAKR